MKIAVFCCQGLGDGLISLVLSHNLRIAGHEVITFHPFLDKLQTWFPDLPLSPFPATVEGFDRYFIFYERSERMKVVLTECEKKYPERTTILNPIATLKDDYPYWEQGQFKGDRCLAHNLYHFCKDVLKLKEPTKDNGVVIPSGVTPQKFPKRIIFHPTSSRPGKNWPKEKFLKLAEQLNMQGFEYVFALAPHEKEGWDDVPLAPFDSLSTLASYVAESGYMIGNDSGIGHLASLLGLKTVTICRTKRIADFWRPGWTPGQVVYPSTWIPNLKGFRIREDYWKNWISVRHILKAFTKGASNEKIVS